MSTLVIDRSTEHTSVVMANDDGEVRRCELGIWTSRDAASGGAPSPVALPCRPQRIIVGTGPGSFAGIRSALAYAQGWAVGGGCEVLGLTSAAAFAQPGEPVAVVGDARRGKFWVALFDGFSLATDVFQVEREGLERCVPRGVKVVSPDWRRISAVLAETFGDMATGAPPLDAAALWRAAESNPALLSREPLPIYLNPAVRD